MVEAPQIHSQDLVCVFIFYRCISEPILLVIFRRLKRSIPAHSQIYSNRSGFSFLDVIRHTYLPYISIVKVIQNCAIAALQKILEDMIAPSPEISTHKFSICIFCLLPWDYISTLFPMKCMIVKFGWSLKERDRVQPFVLLSPITETNRKVNVLRIKHLIPEEFSIHAIICLSANEYLLWTQAEFTSQTFLASLIFPTTANNQFLHRFCFNAFGCNYRFIPLVEYT